MEEVAISGRCESAEPWDKKGQRVVCKSFDDKKVWFFTTWEAVTHLCSFEELDAIIGKEEAAFELLRQPNEKGGMFVVLPPPPFTSRGMYLHVLSPWT